MTRNVRMTKYGCRFPREPKPPMDPHPIPDGKRKRMMPMADKVPNETTATMMRQGLIGTRWAAYQNAALDSSLLGDIRYLAVGPSNTFKEPPPRYPDSQHGTGWAYLFAGWVNLKTGEIEK